MEKVLLTFSILGPIFCHDPVRARSEETRRAFNIPLLKHDMEYRGRQTHDINNIGREKLRLKNTEESHEEN